MDLPKFKTPLYPYRLFYKLVYYYLALQPKCKRKTSTTTKIQPVLKKSRGYPKGLKNKLTLAVRVIVYIRGEAQFINILYKPHSNATWQLPSNSLATRRRLTGGATVYNGDEA